MRNFSPVENTGIIVDVESARYLGSCFVYRYPEFALTAEHVVRGLDSKKIAVCYPGSRAGDQRFAVHRITRHPTADLAVLTIEPPDERAITWPHTEVWNDYSYGVDVSSFGFPRDATDGRWDPVQRLFKGYVQRFFRNESHLGYCYQAAELSFPCPSGLSGSMIINSHLGGRLYGIVTENHRATTEHDRFTEVKEDGKVYEEVAYNAINYGVCLWLPSVEKWLEAIVPTVPHEEILRRGDNQHLWIKEEGAT